MFKQELAETRTSTGLRSWTRRGEGAWLCELCVQGLRRPMYCVARQIHRSHDLDDAHRENGELKGGVGKWGGKGGGSGVCVRGGGGGRYAIRTPTVRPDASAD